jgi:hypothetical protein
VVVVVHEITMLLAVFLTVRQVVQVVALVLILLVAARLLQRVRVTRVALTMEVNMALVEVVLGLLVLVRLRAQYHPEVWA